MKMDVKIILAIFMIGLITQGHAQLYCYVCENCADGNNLSEASLISCSGEETTPPAHSTEESSESSSVDQTTETTNSSSESSTGSISPEISTTTEPTTPSSSPSQSTEQTTQSTDSSTEPSTEPSTVPSTVPSTSEPSGNITTITIPNSPITTTSVEAGTESTLTTPEITTQTNPTVPPLITSQPTGTPPSFARRDSFKQSGGYSCFVLRNEVNGTEQVQRGCVASSPSFDDMCTKANKNVMPGDCRICWTDGCNSASGIMLSGFLLLCSICTLLSW